LRTGQDYQLKSAENPNAGARQAFFDAVMVCMQPSGLRKTGRQITLAPAVPNQGDP